jgi:hypothetical protein
MVVLIGRCSTEGRKKKDLGKKKLHKFKQAPVGYYAQIL